MSYDHWNRRPWQPWESDEIEAFGVRPKGVPGKRTLTMSLPPCSTSMRSSMHAPVQHKADPVSDMTCKPRAALTRTWMDAAMRPDLHDMPVQRKGAEGEEGEEGEEGDQASTSLAASGSGNAMTRALQAKMESAFDADFSAVRIHEGRPATGMGALAYTQGTDIHFAPGQQRYGRVNTTTQAMGVGGMDDDIGGDKGTKKQKSVYIPYKINVTRAMSGEEFRVAAMKQVFGGVIENARWHNIKPSYTPDKSPYAVDVDAKLLNLHRGAVNARRGFKIDDQGGIDGSKGRAEAFHQSPDSGDKTALMNEIDRRYYEAVGVSPGTKIKTGEQGRASLWKMIRDEVLFQHEYIADLPPEVKKMIRFSVEGKTLTPKDYDQLFRIAQKIEWMKAGQVGDYVSKINGSTTNLDEFEKSVDKYTADMAQRTADAGEREHTKTKLVGLEETYKLYRAYLSALGIEALTPVPGVLMRSLGTALGDHSPLPVDVLRRKLEASLKANGFASIDEFGAFINDFERGFKQASAVIVDDLLARYEARLFKEKERYQNRSEVEALHVKLGGVRATHTAYKKDNDAAKQLERQRWMDASYVYVPPKSPQQQHHEKQAASHKQANELEVAKLAKTNPVFNEAHLPSDKQIDQGALSSADVDGLQALLLSHIDSKIADIGTARGRVATKPSLIYKMDEMMPLFYTQQSIASGSIFDNIIRDKRKDDAIEDLFVGIIAAIVAIALTVVSLGTAAPALVAAGAAAGAFGISAYMAYDEFQRYVEQEDLADVGLANDPSAVWLVVAIVGAALDMGAAAKALRTLGPAATAFKVNDNADEFAKAVKALQDAGELDAKMAAAADKAARANAAFKAAKGDLANVLGGKLYSFPGPLADPEVYRALVLMAKAKIQETGLNIVVFIDEVKAVRAASKWGTLSPEELAKAKEAWEAAQKLVKEEAEAVAKYGDSLSRLLARTDLSNDLRTDIMAQIGRATNNPSVDDNAVRTTISAMRGAEKPHNVSEFLAELRHVNQVASSKGLAKGSKVYSGVKQFMPDGSARMFDLGDGIIVNISPVSEADALYRAGGKVHLDEVKRTASALVNKIRKKPQQLTNLTRWRKADPDRVVSIVIESEKRWTNLLGTPNVLELLVDAKIHLKIGGQVFDPAALKAFYAKIFAKYKEHVLKGRMSDRAFFESPEMATLAKAATFVGYP